MRLLHGSQILKRLCFLTGMFLLITNLSMAQQPSQVGDAAGVKEVAAAFERSWNVHDMDALANLFADDADFINVVGMWWRSREAIRQAHLQTHQTIFKASTLAIDSTTIKFITPDIAVAHMTWTLTGHLTPDGKPGPTRHGILSFVLKRQEKTWLVQSAQNTDIIASVVSIPQEQQKMGK
jgi:uncharacterized protein (TIGR02246 family)